MMILYICMSLLENFIILSFPGLFFKEKSKLIKVLYCMGMSAASYCLDTLNFPYLTLFAIIMLIFYCWMNFNEKIYTTFFYVLFIFTVLYLINIITLLIENCFIDDVGKQIFQDRLVYPVCVIGGKIVFVTVFLYFKKHKVFLLELLKLKRQLLAFMVAEVILFFLVIVISSLFIQEKINPVMVLLLILMLSLIYLIFFNQYAMLLQTGEELSEEQMRNRMLEADKMYYKDLQSIYEKNRSINHDMKSHLNLLHNMIENDKNNDALAYIEQVYHVVKDTEIIHTKRATLNYILNTKMAEMKEADVKIIMEINDTLAILDDMDLCILLGNLLDNSLEAVCKCERKLIRLSIGHKDDFIYIDLSNSYDKDEVIIKDDRLISNKKDHHMHGFGFRNIEQIVEKYQGKIEFSAEELFQIFIMFDDNYHRKTRF